MTRDVLMALLPIIVLIGLGMALRTRRFLDASFWPLAERLGYYVLLPCLFFHGLATARLDALPVRELALTLILSTIAVSVFVVAIRPLLRLDGPAFTSVFQGSVRFNNYVGVTLASGVRRQNIWRNSRRKLAECRPRLRVDVRRRACGAASADARWSVV